MGITISMAITSITIASISRPLAIVVDTIAIRSMVVRTGLVDIRAGTAIVSSISRPLAITMSISITSIVSMETLGASVSVAGGMAIAISSISRPLAITMSITITSIVSMKTLWASVGVAGSMAIAISWLGISRPLAITMSNIVTISVTGRVIAISMVRLGHMD